MEFAQNRVISVRNGPPQAITQFMLNIDLQWFDWKLAETELHS
jgi:hypothetical protein